MADDGLQTLCAACCAPSRSRCCRVDLVVRRAFITPELMDLGITAYLTACGESPAEAARTLQAALAAFTDALCGHSTVE